MSTSDISIVNQHKLILSVSHTLHTNHPNFMMGGFHRGQDGTPKDLSKGNDFMSIALDSLRRLFSKSEDEYPMKEPALGYTMKPKAPKRNTGDWKEEKK